MIVKILKAARNFPGVKYNTNKVDKNKGELMKVVGFGPLQYLGVLRPQDYVNYLKMISALNRRVEKPQFHAVISAKGNTYSKEELTEIGAAWMDKMGYGNQPYLIVFHKDTDNNHVHLVSTRVSREGKKIDSAYEKIRAQKSIATVLGYEAALQYRFSTVAQFYTVIEALGFPGRDFDQNKLIRHITDYPASKQKAGELSVILNNWLKSDGSPEGLKTIGIELVFHAADGKRPYGYTLIDHNDKQVYKGSDILPLRYLLIPDKEIDWAEVSTALEISPSVHIPPVWIAADVDDQQVLGMKRRRQKKARTNMR